MLKKYNNYMKENENLSLYTIFPECTKIDQSKRLKKCQTNWDGDSLIDGIIRDFKFS